MLSFNINSVTSMADWEHVKKASSSNHTNLTWRIQRSHCTHDGLPAAGASLLHEAQESTRSHNPLSLLIMLSFQQLVMDSISGYQTSLAMALWETPASQTKDPIINEDSQNKVTTPAQCVECWTTNKDLRDLLPRGQLPLTAQVWVPRITCGPGARPEIQRSQDPWLWWCRPAGVIAQVLRRQQAGRRPQTPRRS